MSWMKDAIGWVEEKFVYDLEPELDELSNVLRRGSADKRVAAVRQLAHMKADGAISLLIGALKDEDAGVRATAASALGTKRNADGAVPVAVLLGDDDAGIRALALKSLSAMGTPEPPGWFRKLFWEPGTKALNAQRVADYVATALDDEDFEVRLAALRILPRHGAPGVEAVRTYFEAEERPELGEHLGEVLDELGHALHVQDAVHRKAAVEALHALYGRDAMQLLQEALNDGDSKVRRAAVDAVTDLGPHPALDELLPRLQDDDEGVVVKVIESLVTKQNLAELDDKQVDRIHVELLKLARRRAGNAQRTAVWAVGQIGNVSALTTLRELIDDSSEEALLSAACVAIGKLDDPRATDPLIALLKPETPSGVVVNAIRGLTRIGDVRAIPALVRLWFSTTRSDVEAALERAFDKMCGEVEEAAQEKMSTAETKDRVAAIKQALSEPRLVHALLAQVLDGGDEEVTSAAIDVLRKQGHDVEALARAALTVEDKDADTRIVAIALFASLKPADGVTLLNGLLSDADEPSAVHRHAVSGLKRIGSDEATAALEAHREHASEDVQGWVEAALG